MPNINFDLFVKVFIGSVGLNFLLMLVIYRLSKKYLDNLTRIPSEEWFKEVKSCIDQIPVIVNNQTHYSLRLDHLEQRLLILEGRVLK